MTAYNAWKGFLLGAIGGAVGAIAMKYYWDAVLKFEGKDPRQAEASATLPPELEALQDISLLGQQYQEGESSTAALGRILYTRVTGQAPRSKEAKNLLSYLVHYGISMGYAGLYSAVRGKPGLPDLAGGALMGSALWLLGDELLMPAAGLTAGPAAYPPETHLHSWGAHLAYGIGAALSTQVLEAVTDNDGHQR